MGISLFPGERGRLGLTVRLSIAMAVAMLIGAAVLVVTSAVQEKKHFSQELGEYLNEEMDTLLITLAEPVAFGHPHNDPVNVILGLAVTTGVVYARFAGGAFGQFSGYSTNLARWDGTDWSAVGSNGAGEH